MPATILDGRKTREELLPELMEKIRDLPVAPTLAIIQVGDRPDSNSFIRAKNLFANKIGVKVKHIKLPEKIQEKALAHIVLECNADTSIQGVIVQLPLPEHVNKNMIIDAIDPRKDVDALTATSVKGWLGGEKNAIMPATARGIRELLERYGITLRRKKVAVVGRSMLVGKPIAAMCMSENATVTICHSRTPDLMKETRNSDVIIVAAGKPKLIRNEYTKDGQIVVDVGINTVEDESSKKPEDEIPGKKMCGDVDFENVKEKVSAISPVPGGVGPMTVLALFENLADLCSVPKRDIM